MAVTWPTFLQNFLNNESFSITKGDTVLRSQMAVGPAKLRRVSTRAVDVYTVSINVHHSIAIQFNNFYNTTLNGGVTPFNFVDPFTQQMATFRIMGSISITPIGSAGTFRVSMSWEKLP